MCEACAEFVRAIHGTDDNKIEKLNADKEIRLAEIHRDEAIQIAKIQQRMNESDNAAELVAAETAAEVQADVIDSLTPEPEPAEAPVIVVDAPAEPELADDMAEPPPAADGGSEPPESKRRSSAYGNSGWFG